MSAAVGEGEMTAPDLIYAETVFALRGLERGRQISKAITAELLTDLVESSLRALPIAMLVEAAWELRERVSTYDAFYVALAGRLACPLITADLRLARAAEPDIPVIAV